ncbi:hypothetical protein ABT408_35040, partial [Streptomyces halstedii]
GEADRHQGETADRPPAPCGEREALEGDRHDGSSVHGDGPRDLVRMSIALRESAVVAASRRRAGHAGSRAAGSTTESAGTAEPGTAEPAGADQGRSD